MYPNLFAKQIMNFQKTAFDNAYKSMFMLQDHNEKLTNTLLEQATWIPEEGNRVITQWLEIFKKCRDDYKTAMYDVFSKMEDLLADTE
jgi:hypothetical protein